MKEDNMNYDAIYQETASHVLLQARQLRTKVEMNMNRLMASLEIPCKDGKGLCYDSHDLLVRSMDGRSVNSSMNALNGKFLLPESCCTEEMREKLETINSLKESYEETSQHYIDLETSHLIQFADYARCRIEQEGCHKEKTAYRMLCTLDTFCCAEDEGYVSGQTMVLVKQLWDTPSTPRTLRKIIREILEGTTEDYSSQIRSSLRRDVFLSCKVGSYYPLTFGQLWDQMAVGMNFDRE